MASILVLVTKYSDYIDRWFYNKLLAEKLAISKWSLAD